MNEYVIVLTLSRRSLSLQYHLGSGAPELRALGKGKWPAPLAFYVTPNEIVVGEEAVVAARGGNPQAYTDYFRLIRSGREFESAGERWPAAQLLLFGVEEYLRYFFREVWRGNLGSLEGNRERLPLVLCFEPDLDKDERVVVEKLFRDRGYASLQTVSSADIAGAWLNSVARLPYTLMAWSDGVDMYLILYRKGESAPVALRRLSAGLGRDGRIDVMAEQLWTDWIMRQSWGLVKENELPVLREVAQEFLRSGEAEIDGEVTLSDGYSYNYNINRNSLSSVATESSGGVALQRELQRFLDENGIADRGQVWLILRGDAAGSDYFRTQMQTGFGAVSGLDREMQEGIDRYLPSGGFMPRRPVRPAEQPEAPSRLVCREFNVTLDLKDGALIGRVEGPYASRLSTFKFISARHAMLTRDGSQWIIADVGSRNGTAVNGKWCYTPLPFRKGDTVRLGNFYDFIAE